MVQGFISFSHLCLEISTQCIEQFNVTNLISLILYAPFFKVLLTFQILSAASKMFLETENDPFKPLILLLKFLRLQPLVPFFESLSEVRFLFDPKYLLFFVLLLRIGLITIILQHEFLILLKCTDDVLERDDLLLLS